MKKPDLNKIMIQETLETPIGLDFVYPLRKEGNLFPIDWK